MTVNPHLAESPGLAGVPPGEALAGAIVVHGRGQEPAYMLDNLVSRLTVERVAYVLPRAAGMTWYPERFLEPVRVNQPWLGYALDACEAAYRGLAGAGLGPGQIVVAGFSQGGCLVADWVAREPRRYAGVAILTGALIGAGDEVVEPGRLDGVPVFLGTSELDAWVPVERVGATARAFERAGADVTLRIDDDPEHRIDADEVRAVSALLESAARARV